MIGSLGLYRQEMSDVQQDTMNRRIHQATFTYRAPEA